MKPIDQADTDDCFRACVASLFELSLADVPHFIRDEAWPECVNTWLRERGVPIRAIPLDGGREIITFLGDVRIIITGFSPRDVRHAVIARGKKLEHDPHPSRAGITWDHRVTVWLFVPVDPIGADSAIRAAALEDAARVCDEVARHARDDGDLAERCADEIRVLASEGKRTT